jgi:hypothetical protein
MFKSKFFIALGALVALAAIVAGSALAAGNAAPKATGDVTFTNMGQTQHWAFVAQDLGNGTAKGSVLDEYAGGTATSKVISASVNGQDATFTTEMTSSTLAPWAFVGDRFVYTVHDGGEGANGSGDWMQYQGRWHNGVFDTGGAGRYDITSGNIQVH